MTERKFTDEEVIKLLNDVLLTKTEMFYARTTNGEYTILYLGDLIDLINRQRSEIERLKAGKQSIKELADEMCNRIGETGITDYNTYLGVAELIRKVMGEPCTDSADCSICEHCYHDGEYNECRTDGVK